MTFLSLSSSNTMLSPLRFVAAISSCGPVGQGKHLRC